MMSCRMVEASNFFIKMKVQFLEMYTLIKSCLQIFALQKVPIRSIEKKSKCIGTIHKRKASVLNHTDSSY